MPRTRMANKMGMTRVHRGIKIEMMMTTNPDIGGATMVMNMNPVNDGMKPTKEVCRSIGFALGRAFDDGIPCTPPRASRRAALTPSQWGSDDDAEMPLTPSPRSQTNIYRAVAKTVGSTPVMIKKVTDAMMTVAAMQLKSNGSFKVAGKFAMNLKSRRKHVATSMKDNWTQVNMKPIVRASPLKKFKEVVNCPCPDAD